ncbi:MAG: hypothetical protein IJ280_07300 [Bacteroidales bacterium]|nr:hypothetical protein [Bacteroidales bacterium]
MPDSLTYIGNNAFSQCTSLASITSRNPIPPVLGKNCFYDYYSLVYVPEGSIDAYTSANGWNKFYYFYPIKENENDDENDENEDTDALSSASEQSVRIAVCGRRITIDGSDSYEVYSINGLNLGQAKELPTGIYIVKVGHQTQKIIIR